MVKTRLEHELERYEETAAPLWPRVLFILLFFIICALGLYSIKLRQDISNKEDELIMIKENYHKERSDLLSRIKRLENKVYNVSPDSNNND